MTSALASPDRAGAVLIGPGGVGKTRLAAECLDRGRAAGYAVARVAATRSASGIALGALAPLLPDLGERSVNLLGAAREALAERAGGQPLLLFVDDAHLLDEASAALLLQIAADHEVFVLVTVRAGEEVSDAITALWKEGHAERIEVAPLSTSLIDDLVGEALPGPIDPVSRSELARVSRGNPLALRELVYAATEAGILRRDGATWRLTGPVPVSSRLADLVAERLGSLSPDEYAALEVLALGEPLGLALFERLIDLAVLERLERRGLVVVRMERGRLEAWLAHPLHGEVVRSRLGVVRTRNLLRVLAEMLETTDKPRPGDVLRIATWRLESGTDADPDLLVAAARRAYVLLDFELARRCARAAWDREPTFVAGHVLGHALSELGHFAEAEPVLVATTGLASSDEERVLVAMARSENLFRLGMYDEAVAVCEAAEDTVVDPDWRLELTGHRATFVLLLGDPRGALELVAPALAGPIEGGSPRPMIEAAVSAAPALAWDARPDEARDLAVRAYAAHREVHENALFQSDPGIHVVGLIGALLQGAYYDEAAVFLDAAWQQASEAGQPQGLAWFALLNGILHGDLGEASVALHWYRRSSEYFGGLRLSGRQQWALAGVAHVAALLGRVDEAETALAESALLNTGVRFNAAGTEHARAWLYVARGEPARARDALLAVAEQAEAGGSRSWATRSLHDLARLGEPARALACLEPLAGEGQGRLLPLQLAHTRALVDDDPAALGAVSDEFETVGARLLAAESAADGSRAWTRAGRPREAAAAAQRSRTLAEACPGVRTPALALAGEVVPLTRREREVALLAAQGLSSKMIAERLYVSVRTVDNHLQRVYDKLGARGRDELAALLGSD